MSHSDIRDHIRSLSFDHFVRRAEAAQRHYGGAIDVALSRAAGNELLVLLTGIPADEDDDGRLAFYLELDAMAEVAGKLVKLNQQLRGVPARSLFALAVAELAGDELPF